MYRSQEVHPSEPRAEDSVEDNYEFRGATLTISSNDDSQAVPSSHTTSQPAVQTGKDATTPTSPPEQPRASICEAPRALVSAESIRPRIGSPRHFFCFRNGLFEQAIKDCTEILLKPSFDSDILGNWLLTEISHWDHERERIVILTTKALYVIKFDFIALRILKKEKILMNRVDTIIHGKLTYPTASFVPKIEGLSNGVSAFFRGDLLSKSSSECNVPFSGINLRKKIDLSHFQAIDRNEIGVRLMWNKGQPIPAATSWNPFATDIPWKTFTNHPIHGYQDQYNSLPSIREEIEANRKTYSVEHLHEALVQLINNPQPNIESANINYNCQLEETPIVLENYVGIGAVFHNKNNLGFFKVRGKFSF
ncbi:tumor protein p63-regulated gene 1-like protein isoform X1 [Phlebotomus argentipes]|uniref:tumor protein p63-regulated gene 1-like protein isoform X1 n=1 Tax=Phlebotomus argentipes TaxID=94469 RepID=UPI002892B09D|nr:tumor protein p63-regulated gene 1-like protein isoform X1 [Phlebotomus argentipes]